MRSALAWSLLVAGFLSGVASAEQGKTTPPTTPPATPGPSVTPAAPAAAASDSSAHAATSDGPIPNPSTTAHSLDKTDLEAWLDGFVPYALANGDIAGAVVTVVKDGELIFAKGYGYSDVAHHTPVDPERTLFRPGSVSKLFTWTAVMQLVEQGKLDLDRNINDYLDFHIPDRPDGPITLRNVMTHTPGFEEQIKSLIADNPQAVIPLARYARDFTPTRIFKAGSTPAYSNYATAVAGYLVQRVSGQSFDDYLDEHIFKPLGMTHASFRQPLPAALLPDMGKGYRIASEPDKPYEYVVPAPAGSLAASGVDMAKFMIAHLQDGEFHGQRILKAETAEQMHTTALTMVSPLNRMDLGFYEQNYNGHRVISHGGDTVWMHSYLHLFLDDHVGLFMSFNSQGRQGAAGQVRQALFDAFVDRYFPGPWVTGSVPKELAAQHARMMAGYYDDSRRPDRSFMSLIQILGAPRVVVAKDGTLTMSLMIGRNGVLRHYQEVAPFVWRDTASGWRMAAKVEGGRVVRVSMDELSPFMVFDPTPGWRSPAWLVPATVLALCALLLTGALWPVAAISRRRHNFRLPVTGLARRGHLISRVVAIALVLMSVAWLTVLISGTMSLAVLTSSLDPLLLLMYLLSVVVYIGGAAAMLYSVWLAWTTARPLGALIWTGVLALSSLVLLYVAILYHL
ncbi:MAG TPA: serine hydrolase domain-containing protein, partial [Steroidobacteraceae bacterium]|nr:serine hydrolase domain-containing protein [Steroidobacteraceae bacterium]